MTLFDTFHSLSLPFLRLDIAPSRFLSPNESPAPFRAGKARSALSIFLSRSLYKTEILSSFFLVPSYKFSYYKCFYIALGNLRLHPFSNFFSVFVILSFLV